MFKKKTAFKTAAFLLSAAMIVSPAAVFAEESGSEASAPADETFQDADSEAEQQAMEAQKTGRADGNWKVWSGEITPVLSDEEKAIFAEAHEGAGFYVESYDPAVLLATQVVSGTNYAYLCRLAPAGDYEPAWRIAVVYQDTEGKNTMTSVRDLDLNALNIKESQDAAGLVGAFEAADGENTGESTAAASSVITGDAGKALEKALKGSTTLTPVVLLGTQETEDGTEQYFLYLCKGKILASDEKETLCLLEVRSDAENAAVTGIDELDLNSYVNDGPRTYITGNGALSIELPDFSWRSVEDPDHLAAFSDKANRVELSHVAVGESYPAAQIASDSNAAVFQNYYSTPAEIFVYTGIVNQNDAGEMIKAMLQSVRVLRYGFEPGEVSQSKQPSASPSVTPTAAPSVTPDPSRGEQTGYEAIVYPERSDAGTSIFEYTNGNWYDINNAIYVPGKDIEKGYIWYTRSGTRMYLFAYPADLTITGAIVNAVRPDGKEAVLTEYSDGVWRDYRYVQYVYNGDESWTGADASIVYGSGPDGYDDDDTFIDDGYDDYGYSDDTDDGFEPVEEIPYDDSDNYSDDYDDYDSIDEDEFLDEY